MKSLIGKAGTLLLALWLILGGLVLLNIINFPMSETILAVIALVAGVLIILEIRETPTKNLGRLLLAIFLVLMGMLQLLGVQFAAKDTVMGIFAIVTGALLLLGR